jgi:polyisoprenoid-binding protein YceI
MFDFKKQTIALAACAAMAATAQAQDTLKVTSGDVVVVCPLTVGGSFEAKTKEVSGQVGPAPQQAGAVGGTIQVRLDTLQTGIEMRDHHMKDNYLEVGKGTSYAVAVLDRIQLDKVDGKAAFRASLTLHGQTREVSGTALVQKKDAGVRVEAQFPLKVSEFQIPKPTYLGVGVRDEIQVKVSFSALPATDASQH